MALALYIPVRMKRLEEYERMRAVTTRLEILKSMGSRCLQQTSSDENRSQPPRTDLNALKAGLDALITDPTTDAGFLKPLADASEACRVLLRLWENHASNLTSSSDTKRGLEKEVEILNRSLLAANDLLKHWRRKHWLALLLHG